MALTITHGKRERFNYKGATHHITSRCNNKKHLIKACRDFDNYVAILNKCKKKYGFKLHNFTTVNNHIHLIIRLEELLDISKIMQAINRWYARKYNFIYKRTGHFWEDRFYGELIKDDLQLLTTMIYIDSNPVRAGLCKNPEDWKYSGANHYINGKKNALIDTPEIYINLGKDRKTRQKAYKQLIEIYLKSLKLKLK